MDEVRPHASVWLTHCCTKAASMGDVHHGHTPGFDTDYDTVFTTLPEFSAAAEKLDGLPLVWKQYGPNWAPRLLLGLAFDVVSRTNGCTREQVDAVIEEAWRSFVAELSDPNWHYRVIVNLGGIVPVAGFNELIEICDGVTVRVRTRTFVESLGVARTGLFNDWRDGGHSELVLVAEGKAPKTPNNVVTDTDVALYQRIARSLGAIRLASSGGVHHGSMFCLRSSRFVPIGGIARMTSTPNRRGFSPECSWSDATSASTAGMYAALNAIELRTDKDWASIAVAIRSYESALNRGDFEKADRVIDATTAIEALVGEPTETTFKVRFRVASLLGDSDADVKALFDLVNDFYDLRSKLVHGYALKQKHTDLMQKCAHWVEVARLVICAFMKLAQQGAFTKGENVKNEIDRLLIQAGERARIREMFNERWSAATNANLPTVATPRSVGFYADVPSKAEIRIAGNRVS